MADTNFKFCATCGRKVALKAQFCAWCGANLGTPEETIIGYTTGVVAGTKFFNPPPSLMLLFTTDRTVVAKDLAAEMGKNVFVGVTPIPAKGMGISSIEYREKLYEYLSAQQQSPDDRLAETTTQKIAKILSENKRATLFLIQRSHSFGLNCPARGCVSGE